MPRAEWATKKMLLLELICFCCFVISFKNLLGWKSTLILVPLVLIHEMGHMWMMKRFKIGLRAFIFIPYIGAIVVPSASKFPDDKSESWTVLMGPLWGLGSALLAFGLLCLTKFVIMEEVAFFAAAINLFNLILFVPLDGGLLMKCITRVFTPIWSLATFVFFSITSILFFIVLGIAMFIVAKAIPSDAFALLFGVIVLAVVIVYGLIKICKESYGRWKLIRLEVTLKEEKRGIFKIRPWGPEQKALYDLEMHSRNIRNTRLSKKDAMILALAYFAVAIPLLFICLKTFKS